MNVEQSIHDPSKKAAVQVFSLRVFADADPGALTRILSCFQSRNIAPRRVVAEMCSAGTLCVRIDIADLSEQHLSLIVAKVRQFPCVEEADWQRL